jgi:DNA repair photolyase
VLKLKQGLHIRGDSLYCPLSFSLDSYGNCEADCVHCYLRRLNRVWGQDLKPLDLEIFERTLSNGIKNENPRSSLAWALFLRKTLRFGNKADPFQVAELEHRVSKRVLEILQEYEWPVVIETKFTHVLMQYDDILSKGKDREHILVVISPGYLSDWEILEKGKTTPPDQRLKDLSFWKQKGIRIGVNGEPFIPGYHTIDQFEEMLKLLKDFGIGSYNVYNLHFNGFIANRLHDIGIDIEKIWYYNRDIYWRPILRQLLDLASKYDIVLGCPDFVNSGSYLEKHNTCCGIQVSNPCTFNVMSWKRSVLSGQAEFGTKLLEDSWDGVGDYELGRKVMLGETSDYFTVKDIDF